MIDPTRLKRLPRSQCWATIDIMLTGLSRDVPRVDMHITLHNTLADQAYPRTFRRRAQTAQFVSGCDARALLQVTTCSPL
jgi:hypothetical protein